MRSLDQDAACAKATHVVLDVICVGKQASLYSQSTKSFNGNRLARVATGTILVIILRIQGKMTDSLKNTSAQKQVRETFRKVCQTCFRAIVAVCRRDF